MYSGLTEFVKINSTKANFDAIYSHPDPREYFRVLCGLDYVIPDLAKSPFRAILKALRAGGKRHLKIADLGCSYGINSALLRYPLDISRLALRYASREMQQLDSETLATLSLLTLTAGPPPKYSELVRLFAVAVPPQPLSGTYAVPSAPTLMWSNPGSAKPRTGLLAPGPRPRAPLRWSTSR